jgi:hypothetical protein
MAAWSTQYHLGQMTWLRQGLSAQPAQGHRVNASRGGTATVGVGATPAWSARLVADALRPTGLRGATKKHQGPG